MSADDSIEIEFPSLKQTAPNPVERVAVGRAPGPIEAQLSKAPESDDLSWLAAIFADDDPDPDPGETTDTDTDEVADQGTGEIDQGTGEITDHEATADEVADIDPDDFTPPTTELDLHALEPLSTPTETPALFIRPEDDLEPALTAVPTREPGAEEPVPDLPEPTDRKAADESVEHRPAKKASGFREEIMSTFSQMYN